MVCIAISTVISPFPRLLLGLRAGTRLENPMPSFPKPVWIYAILVTMVLLPACTTHLQKKEQFLRAAGFVAFTPTTPTQIARAQALPQGHIQQVTRNGKTLYVFSDAKQHLLLVGGNPQLERYQQILYKKEVDPAIEDRAFDKALEYDDYAWGGMMGPYFGMPMMMY